MTQKIDADCRIKYDIEVYEGNLPERFAIAWKGYLAGLLEWQVIDLTDYDRFLELLPAIADDPVPELFSSKDSHESTDERLDITDELKSRIQKHINAFGGHLLESYTIAWNGYLAGLLEWQVIGDSYGHLINLLPQTSNPDPILTIFSGRMDEYGLRVLLKEDIEEFQGNLPARNPIAWKAFLRGLWEYGGISPKDYKSLLSLLPPTLDLEDLKLFPERGSTPKTPAGRGISEQVRDELHARIQQQLNAFQGNLPDYYTIAWKAYLLSLQKWLVLDWEDYAQLITLMPPISSPDDPVARLISQCERI